MSLIEFLKDKKICILGYGKQGKSTFKYLRKHFPDKEITIADKNKNIDKSGLDKKVYFKLGNDYLKNIENFDLIIKGPGVILKDIDISKFKDKLITDYELLLKYTDGIKIGITGTKGKSTTSTFLYNVLKDQGKKAFLLGNIGTPILDEIDNITQDSYVVIEVSSHTLEFVKSSPNIAILLDIYPEHLDHCSLEDYIKSKFNIAKFQNDKDIFIYNAENELMKKYDFKYKENDIGVFLNNYDNSLKNKVYLKDNRNIF